MAVARMTAAEYHSVSAALKGAEDEHGIYSAGAWHADYLYIRRIIKSVIARQIGARV